MRASPVIFLTSRKWKMPPSSVRQKTLPGSVEERNLPRCQSTTCIVMLWHSKTSGVHFMFWSIQFFHGTRLPINTEGSCGLKACEEGLWLQGCQFDSPHHLGNLWDCRGGAMRGNDSLQPFQPLLLKCPYVRQRSTKWPGWQFAGNAGQLPPNETVRVRGTPPGGQNDEECVSW